MLTISPEQVRRMNECQASSEIGERQCVVPDGGASALRTPVPTVICNMSTSGILQKLDDLIRRLASPVSEDLLKEGWSEDSAAGIRARLEAFRREIDSLGDLPPVEPRPVGMVRALDFWGVQEGEFVDELAAFEHDLRRI